ncbi:MAG: hypothetical protein ACTSX7_12770 [Alphaproteobacteria bacterium]
MSKSNVTLGIKIAAVIAVLFGIATIVSGGRVLFGDPVARAAAGNAVAFVLWFNFTAGFVYIAAGVGLLLGKGWAVWTAAFIAASTLVVFAAFGIHISSGGAYEMRTLGAMVLRSLVWITIAMVSYRTGLTHKATV